jgi:cobyrinic acid a,c-diamide synthase
MNPAAKRSLPKGRLPRLVIAGTGGDAGKTLVTLGLAAAWRLRSREVAVFKKGPDYIDAAWLGFAAGRPARNLDTYMMGRSGVAAAFYAHALDADICLIEGNRGLYDGLNAQGTHCTAELAKLLNAPVLLLLDVTKVTRTAAATVLGCRTLDPQVQIAGVILNRTAGRRHEKIVRESIESICGIPVLGAIPKLGGTELLPSRHLGLVTPQEHPQLEGIQEAAASLVEKYLDLSGIEEIAKNAPEFRKRPPRGRSILGQRRPQTVAHTARIAYFHDSAFSFYYPDNLEALEAAGAELLPISSMRDQTLPPCDGLYIGGGFPETHAEAISANRGLLQSVRAAAEQGLPIFAECGGLIYLCRSLDWKGKRYPLAGVFPLDLAMETKPQGHGYMEIEVEGENPFFPLNTVIRGHEFHYTKILSGDEQVRTIYRVNRGQGCFSRRDGLTYRNVLASYLHLHALGVPIWAENFVNLSKNYQKGGK